MTKNIIITLLVVACLFLLFGKRGDKIHIRNFTDTIIIRDTIVDLVPQPYAVYQTRIDTVLQLIHGDTVHVPVYLPIERKEYRTEDYLAVVEGYRPSLAHIELYPKTHYITKTEIRTVTKRQRFGLGIQIGYGITGDKPSPYIGVGVQYNLIRW